MNFRALASGITFFNPEKQEQELIKALEFAFECGKKAKEKEYEEKKAC